MDFLDPKKKRKHRLRLFAGYGLMAILIALGSTVLLFEASGYDVDMQTGEIIHNGLVFVDAHPEPAEVYLDGKRQGRTDMRLVIPEGRYTLELRREGYRTWQRTFNLEGSKIERFVYPFLFPKELKPQDFQLYAASPTMATQSPDRRWLLVQQPGTLTVFDVVDTRAKNAEASVLTLPPTLFKEAAGERKLELVEWSTDNRHILVKHMYKGGEEYALIDRADPVRSINLNAIFKEPFTHISLLDKRADQFYLFNQPTGTLKRADSRSGAVSPYLDTVLAYHSHGDKMVLYATTKSAAAGNVAVMLRDGSQEYKIRELPKDEEYLLNMARFDGAWYTAMGSPKDQRVYVYKDVIHQQKIQEGILSPPIPETTLRADKPKFLTISANARFIALQGESRMSVYDAETERLRQFGFAPAHAPAQKLVWMDGHRLTTVVHGKVVVMDFDGANRQELIASGENFIPYFDRDYKVMYTVGPSSVVPGRSALVQTPLVVPGN